MKYLTAVIFALFWISLSPVTAGAQKIDSAYSKLDFDNGCKWANPASAEEPAMGVSAICSGFKDYPVYFAEDDVRQLVSYGHVEDPELFSGGFGEFNYVNETIEWRLSNGEPFAAIHRWFIENMDPETGSPSEAAKGQVLVVSTVAKSTMPADRRKSCVVGYVDALANKNANVLARNVADTMAVNFTCGVDLPKFHGVRGSKSGSPYVLAE